MDGLAETFSAFIAGRTGARRAQVVSFRKLSGGAIQDNFGLTLDLEGGDRPGRQAFVIRQDAPSGVAESLSRPQEFRVLQAAFGAGVTAPEPLWLCEDPAVSGRVFYVMAMASGTASPKALVRGELSQAGRRKLVRRLGAELARLHTVTPPVETLGFLPPPEQNHPARSRVALYRRYLADINAFLRRYR